MVGAAMILEIAEEVAAALRVAVTCASLTVHEGAR